MTRSSQMVEHYAGRNADLSRELFSAVLGPPRYTPEEVSATQALASQVAVALGHVALFRRARAVAAAETRQALARDLHDSVSQTLFSVTLHVRAAQAALRKAGLGPDHSAARALTEVSELNQGARAEMRAPISELP